jgi:hypothetical protein
MYFIKTPSKSFINGYILSWDIWENSLPAQFRPETLIRSGDCLARIFVKAEMFVFGSESK